MDLIALFDTNSWSLCFFASVLWFCTSYILVVIIYDLIFHPLSKYPGPWWARTSPVYRLYHLSLKYVHLKTHECHSSYGSVIRCSPNQLIFNNPEALKDVYSNGTNHPSSKGHLHNSRYTRTTTSQLIVDNKIHGQKRRITSQAFTSSALSSYEPTILLHIQILCEILLGSGKAECTSFTANVWSIPQDVKTWSMLLLLDIKSDVIYGETFGILTKPDFRWLVSAISSSTCQTDLSAVFSRLYRVISGRLKTMVEYLIKDPRLEQRRIRELLAMWLQKRESLMGEKPQRIDMISTLLAAHDPKTGTTLPTTEVWEEVESMVSATDATSKALSSTFMYLSRNETAYKKVLSEIRTTFPTLESIHSGPLLSSCHYLRACIDESLRLTTFTHSPSWRTVSSDDGTTISGYHIPQGCEVAVSIYSLHRNPTYFPDPDTFNPDRFMPSTSTTATHNREPTLKKPKFDFFPSSRANTKFPVSPSSLSPDSFQGIHFPASPSASGGSKDNPAFAPFGVGAISCPGKGLVYLQLRLIIARVVWEIDFRAAAEGVEAGEGLWERFLWGLGRDKGGRERECMLQFKRREDNVSG